MGTQQPIRLPDVSHGRPPSRARLLAPLRYLLIRHPEKAIYDFYVPIGAAVLVWGAFSLMSPRIALFGDDGLLRFVRDLLIMGVPFMIGALAAVAMGAGVTLDRRPIGTELFLDDDLLTLRQFVCYLLGYLSFLGLLTLGAAVAAGLMHDPVMAWTSRALFVRSLILEIGSFFLSVLLSSLTVCVFWSLYFMTDVVNRQ